MQQFPAVFFPPDLEWFFSDWDRIATFSQPDPNLFSVFVKQIYHDCAHTFISHIFPQRPRGIKVKSSQQAAYSVGWAGGGLPLVHSLTQAVMKEYLPQAESFSFTSHRSYRNGLVLDKSGSSLFFQKVSISFPTRFVILTERHQGKAGHLQPDLDQLLQGFESFNSNFSKITCSCLTTVIHNASSSSHAYLLNISFSDQELKLISLSLFKIS